VWQGPPEDFTVRVRGYWILCHVAADRRPSLILAAHFAFDEKNDRIGYIYTHNIGHRSGTPLPGVNCLDQLFFQPGVG
jgi:hypothetical protein